jgi:hypothetical protein
VAAELQRFIEDLMQASDNGLPPGFGNLTPQTVEAGDTGSTGTQTDGWAAARHEHPVRTGAPTNPTGAAASEGTGTALMRADATIKQGIGTTKGDLVGFGPTPTRLPVGSDGQPIVADSGQSLGLRYGYPVLSPSQITGNQNNYAPGVPSGFWRLSSDASRNITGLAGGVAGLWIVVQNIGANPIVLTDQDAASSASNRFACDQQIQVTLNQLQSAFCWYDGTSSRWRAVKLSSLVLEVASNANGALPIFTTNGVYPYIQAGPPVATPAQITANQNDYLPSATSPGGFWRLASDAARDITGIVSVAVPHSLRIWNVGGFNITLKHQNAGSAAANRFLCTGAADVVLAPDECADLAYDPTTQRWRVFKL